ncbi:MAG: hypothetical protein Q4C47_06640, partial [Planctomycetia bacterium]|nr:hypothetical protein [Planctomycetia bacterium]
MADDIAVLGVKIESEKAVRNLDTLRGKLSVLSGAAKEAGIAMGAAFAGAKLVSFGRTLLQDAADAQEAVGKFEAVFRQHTRAASVGVRELVASYNFSTKQAQNSLSTIADIFQKSGMDIREAMELSLDLNRTAADVEAFTNATGGLAQVTHALTSAMNGETEAAKTLGILVMDNMVREQMAMEARAGLTFQTEQQAKIHARYSVIQKQTASMLGQVARESDNYTNRLRRLRAGFSDLKTSLGAALIGPATRVVEVFQSAVDTIDEWSPAAKTAVVATGALAAAFLTVGVPLTKLILAYRSYTAIQAQSTLATAAQATSKAKLTDAEFANLVAQQHQISAGARSTAAITAETAAVNANTASWGANSRARIANASASAAGTSGRAAGSVGTVAGAGVFAKVGSMFRGLASAATRLIRPLGTLLRIVPRFLSIP